MKVFLLGTTARHRGTCQEKPLDAALTRRDKHWELKERNVDLLAPVKKISLSMLKMTFFISLSLSSFHTEVFLGDQVDGPGS